MPFLNLTRTLFNIIWNYRHQSRADLHKTKTFKLLKTFFLNVSLKRLSEAIRDEIMKKNIKCQHFPAQWNATAHAGFMIRLPLICIIALCIIFLQVAF